MSQHWSWWMGGLALAAVALGHWLALKRQMAVSGRLTAIVNRLRFGPRESLESVSKQDIIDAIQQMSADEFGDDAVDELESVTEVEPPPRVPSERPRATPDSIGVHVAFFGSLVAGGFLARWKTHATQAFDSELLATLFSSHPWLGFLVLALGGLLVGFGTRMASGCTSGHGLCGVSRLQPGSLLASAMFFGAGVATAFALSRFL